MQGQNHLQYSSNAPSKRKSKITVMKSMSQRTATDLSVVSGTRNKVLLHADKQAVRSNPAEVAALQGQDLPRVPLGLADPDGDGTIDGTGHTWTTQDGWEDVDDEQETPLSRVVQVKRYYRRVNGYRTRQERNAQLETAWTSTLPMLVDVYLDWKRRYAADEPLNMSSPAGGSSPFSIAIHDIYRKDSEQLFTRLDPNENAVLTIMRYGFIASTPIQPTFAVGMRTLELYRQLRLYHPRLGFQPFARSLAALANIPYRSELRRQISDSFDVYLRIRREVDARVNSYLGRDGPDWRALNTCPPCGYKLEAEPALAVERLWAMDGNGSLKRHAAAGGADTRIFKSDYFLTNADEYKDEVRKQTASKTFIVGAEPGDVGDEDPPPCQDNWKNMQPEHMKRQLDFFEQTGIFLGACRHGLILYILEMIRSGELAKYPLALVAKMLSIVSAAQRAGYDIGCGFRATLAKSSLRSLVRECGFDTLTNSFHGHAHHRLCQLHNHPLVTAGVGLEDFETCERVFSESNDVARTIRFATHYHWRQFIDMHFRHWDEVKYAELSKFIVGNYSQALDLIESGKKAITQAAKLGFDEPAFIKWRKDEITYLEGLKKEPEGDALAVSYVEALMKLGQVQERSLSATGAFVNATPADFKSSGTIKTYTQLVTKLERSKRNADRDLEMAEKDVRIYEEKLEIPAGQRWTPERKEWHGALMYLYQRRFRLALDHLERLVVQRLFELTKANMSDVSYKLRQQIAKALQRRSRAIQTALKNFNVAQKQLDPDSEELTWKTVVQWTELSDFSLLRMARRDIRAEPWANITNRDLMTAYFKKLRAEEEIARCNIEARRLRTWIDDEDRQLTNAADRAESAQELIAVELRELQCRRAYVNQRHRVRLQLLEQMDGFSGTPGPGTRQGATPTPTTPTDVANDSTVIGDDDAEGSDDETLLERAERMEEFETALAGDDELPLSFYA